MQYLASHDILSISKQCEILWLSSRLIHLQFGVVPSYCSKWNYMNSSRLEVRKKPKKTKTQLWPCFQTSISELLLFAKVRNNRQNKVKSNMGKTMRGAVWITKRSVKWKKKMSPPPLFFFLFVKFTVRPGYRILHVYNMPAIMQKIMTQ